MNAKEGLLKPVSSASTRFALAAWVYLVATAGVLCALNVVLRYPGESNPDSQDQYQQILTGHYTDWHPPIMTRWWSLLRVIADGPGTIFTFHILLYWIGLVVLAVALQRRSMTVGAWCVLAVGALPPFLMLNINIAKDTGLLVAMLCAFSLSYLNNVQGADGMSRRSRGGLFVLSILLIAYAALVRTNAVFAVGPLVLFSWPSQPFFRRPLVACAMAGLLIGVILVPTSTFVNRHLLDAAPSGAVESLEFFDVAGTARLANDHAAFGAYDVSERDLDRCYSPIMWDTLPNRCADLWAGVRGTRFGGAGDTPAQPSLSRLWIDVVSRHPVAYLEHRLLAFNSMLYLYVPPHHTEYVRKLNTAANRSDRLSARVLDAIRYNWLMAPATLFAFGCSLLWFASREKRVPELERAAAIVLLVSATFYVLSFLPFGVATDMRYFLWPSMAVLLAAVILIPSLRRSFAARPLAALSLFSPVAAVLLLIAASRMSNALAALLI